jgi:hypothetical protein
MKNYFVLCFAFLISAGMFAQTLEYTNVRRFSSKSVGEIIKNNEVVGYYSFLFVENTDKKNTKYRVEVADNNLNKAKSFDIIRPSNSYLLEVTFNGDSFLLVFYQKKTGLDYVVYSKDGKEMGTLNVADLTRYQEAVIGMSIQSPETENRTVHPIGSLGFVKQASVEFDKTGFQVVGIDNNAASSWTWNTDEKAKMHYYGDILSADENYVVVYLGGKKNMLTKDAEWSLVVLESATGNVVFEHELKGKGDTDLSMLNCFVEKDLNKVTIIGELYAPGDEPLKDQSTGLYIQELDLTGAEVSMHKYMWLKEINKAKKAKLTEEQKESEKKSSLFVHKVVRSKNGTLTLVAEQYKKSVSALGVASVATGGGAAAMEMVVMNMVLLQFDADLNITNYQIIDKKLTRINLPQGYGIAPPSALAAYIKTIGGFDYQFTTGTTSSDTFTTIYKDYNRKEEKSKEKNDVMLGVIEINGGEVVTSRVPFNTDATKIKFQAAKTGFITVTEYFNKTKTVKTRLESLKK